MLSDKSLSDFDKSKKAEWYDVEGYEIADDTNKDKLKNPKKIQTLIAEEE